MPYMDAKDNIFVHVDHEQLDELRHKSYSTRRGADSLGCVHLVKNQPFMTDP